MSRRMPLKGALLLSAPFTVVLAWSLAGAGQEAGKQEAGKQGAGAKPTPLFFGPSACVKCHNEKEPFKDEKLPPVCQCTEMRVWDEFDKHKSAYKALTGKGGAEMSKLLGWKDEQGPNGMMVPGAATKKECLSCHAINVEKEFQDKTFSIEDGVSCVVCHGAYEEWIDEHGSATGRKRERYRELTRAQKEAQKGMTDLWDPSKRVQLCTSCHIGDAAQGRVVTHDMYAAGHPPLPSFEIATFGEEMPRHWQLLREKTPVQQELLKVKPEEKRFENTKLILLSANTSLEASLNLLAAEAKGPEWPDYAQFDCYSCHHDLQNPSWRQERGYKGRPGRLQPRPWPAELARVTGLLLGEKTSQFDEEARPLYQAFDQKPFGEPKDVSAKALDQADLARKRAEKVAKLHVTEATALKLLHALCNRAAHAPDYDAARQVVWAFQVVYSELVDEASSGVIKDVLEKNDAQVRQVLKELENGMRLKLPATQKKEILKELGKNLEALYDYKPADFKKAFEKLSELLPADK